MKTEQQLRVLAIGPHRFISANGFTGDATQMIKTVEKLKNIKSVQLDCAFYTLDELKLSNGHIIKWEDLHKHYDLVHLFTLLPRELAHVGQHLNHIPVVLSTVYWNYLFKDLIVIRNGGNFRRILISIRDLIYRMLFLKNNAYYSWISCILPNSWSEGACFEKYFRLKRTTVCIPVPNSIEVPEYLDKLNRPDYLPQGDYIVCPGAFAYRKNQLSIVRAMKGSGIPIVFMGKPYPNTQNMFDKCINEADDNMHFIGYKSSEDKEYWAVLKHAKAAILASDCETPGIALLEAAAVGARPIVTIQGGTQEYYGLVAEYLNPFSKRSIRQAITNAWARGRLSETETKMFHKFTWKWTAELTEKAYRAVLNSNK